MNHKDHLLALLEKVPATELQDIREWLCHVTALLGCAPEAPTPAPSTPHMGKTDVVIGGSIENDAFHFLLPCAGTVTALTPFILDTGAFEMLVTGVVADQLGLPNKGPIQIAGVTGSSEAYLSEVTIHPNSTSYTLQCVVDPSAIGNLFGLQFFVHRGLWLYLDTKTAQLLWGQS